MTKYDTLSGKKYDVYLAAPLFNEMELFRNTAVCDALEASGYKVYLPQRDGGEAALGGERHKLFEGDVRALNNCAMVVALIDGAHIDEGTCWEMGYAYAKQLPVVMFRTDSRDFMQGHLNVMIEHCGIIVGDMKTLFRWVKEVIVNGKQW